MNKPRKNKLAFTASAALAVTALCGVDQVSAQDGNALEEVVVTGIRGSLQRSMDIKRDSAGVVDAISAEDIGKFPDTNLAESLQRITGVSIDRVNGEGSQVTVRGFGANFNMVTLNGRSLPGGSLFAAGSGAGGARGGVNRAFDFANLAAETVSGVEVYKTGRADVASGGIGATVNIKTLKPLDNPGLQASIALKAMNDTTADKSDVTDDWTPEVSGLVSWTDPTEKFGIAFTFSRSERDSTTAGGQENAWNIATWNSETAYRGDPGDNLYSWTRTAAGAANVTAVVENAPADGQLYARPNDWRWSFAETTRKRTNAQLTLQYSPIDTLTMTLDYTLADVDLWEHRGESTYWIANNSSVDHVIFDDSAVATPIYIHEDLTGAHKDMGFEQQLRMQNNKLQSIGFNANWDVTDTLNLILDMHSSSMDSTADGPGSSSEIAISIGAPIGSSQWLDFSGDMPTGGFTWVDDPGFGNGNGVLDLGDFGTQQGRVYYGDQLMDIDEVRVDGTQVFDNGSFSFGVDSRSVEMHQTQSVRQVNLGGWNVANAGELAPGTLVEFDFPGIYDDYDMSNYRPPIGVRAVDVYALCLETEALYGASQNWSCTKMVPYQQDRTITEDISAAYIQFALQGELGGMPVNMLAGLRYETTDLVSSSQEQRPLYRIWTDNNDFQTTIYDTAAGITTLSDTFDYSNMLPSFDFDISLQEDLKGRFSFSKTIARANYGNLYAGASGFAQTDPTYIGAQPTASSFNPRLLPMESDNVDLSLEWYYADTSYASIGLYEKRVQNFVGTGQELRTLYGMRDESNGPRVERAAAALVANGFVVDNVNLFVMTAVLEHPEAYPNGAADVPHDPAAMSSVLQSFANQVALDYDIVALFSGPDMDPETVWLTSTPLNNRAAKIYGTELAVQHFFGDTGFGIQANYTTVNGDIHFDDLSDPTQSQFALIGLSDTANVVLIYENYGWSARLAYNWRDQFLNAVNNGPGRSGRYTDEYNQWDLNVSYDVTDSFSVFFEGINLTEENLRWHQRSDRQTNYIEDLGARYNIGARYTF